MVPTTKNTVEEEIITVIQIFRHGSKNPLRVFKNKLYEGEVEKPEQLGRLTQKGKLEIYQLGQYTKDRYKNLLDPHYSKENVQIYSTTSERTMMSAQIFAAGLLPPTKEEVWNETLQWQPIPIYLTGPYMLIGIPRNHIHEIYKRNYQEATTEYFEKNVKKDVLDCIGKNVGENITTLEDLIYFHDNYIIGKELGVRFSEWLNRVYPDPVRDYFRGYCRSFIRTDEMKKIYIGPLLYKMITHMKNMIKDRKLGPKLLAFSAHDFTLTSIFHTLDIPFVTWPLYAASLFFELRRRHEGYFVNVYYKATAGEEVIPLSLRGRNFDCGFDHFTDAAMKFAYSEENVMRESLQLKDN